MKVLTGKLVASNNLRLGIIISRFNEFIGEKLLDGALDAAHRHGVSKENITVTWVPGAFEIPLIAKKMATSGSYDAVVALGVLIKGSTPHFDYISAEVSKGIAQVGLSTEVPVIFGVLTTESIEQAIERAGTKHGNKGAEAVVTAIEMVNLMEQL